MSFVIPAPEVISVAVRASADRFPVRRIYCVGQNYADHAREMGSDPTRQAPFFFGKPAQALNSSGVFPYPGRSREVHHEVELVVALRAGGAELDLEAARAAIYGYAVGLDMTRRDLQTEAKKAGRPWDAGKAFDFSAPCSELVPATAIGHPTAGAIRLEVNGELRQHGDLNQMIWSVPEILVHLSGLFRLEAGDLIFTGTPSGVGPIQPGDRMRAEIEAVGVLEVEVR